MYPSLTRRQGERKKARKKARRRPSWLSSPPEPARTGGVHHDGDA